MYKDYIEVKIPILDSVDEMKVVKTFTQEQLWYVCAIAKAFEKNEQQCKRQKEVINKAIDLLNAYIGVLDDTSDLYFENVKSILELEDKEVSE